MSFCLKNQTEKKTTVVYYGATWATFKPKIEKIKKSIPKKNYISRNGTFLHQKNFLVPTKTPLGETGWLSNLYYLLAALASRMFFQNCASKNTFQKFF